ncbi:hypothetical protein BDN72DRAFT_904361 [Pluteus cervinus]|uniref:Uncharacterized protein n=1 Tax=Pluteus cervinus TaxID=181527 RepID=A0ACD3A748_9AGAR|nr:hypothetical protein BDN72DRAFT_904361 [Pluteus cervinus]
MRAAGKTSFDSTCMILGLSREAVLQYPAALVFTHTSIFVLAVYKRNRFPREQRHNVLNIITRDGLVAFSITSVICSIMAPYSTFKQPVVHYVLSTPIHRGLSDDCQYAMSP